MIETISRRYSMIRLRRTVVVSVVAGIMIFCANAQDKAPAKNAGSPTPKTPAQEAPAKAATKAAQQSAAVETLVVKARIAEIPGTFPPNDLYSYVYVMKYSVLEVVKGTAAGKEILVGHYNPRIPRAQIKDAMDKLVDGNVEKFEVGARQTLTLLRPIDKIWKDAKEDEYFDTDDSEKYFAIKADVLK
jgi:hypothetical protein